MSSSDTPRTTPSSSSRAHSLLGARSPILLPLDHHLKAAIAGHAEIVAKVTNDAELDRQRQVAIAALASREGLAGS